MSHYIQPSFIAKYKKTCKIANKLKKDSKNLGSWSFEKFFGKQNIKKVRLFERQ